MTADTLRNDPGNILNALAARARRARSSALAASESVGLAVALAVYVWLPGHWPVALPFLALSAFGLWGLADHVLGAGRRSLSPLMRVAVRSFRWIVGLAGVVTAASVIYILAGILIGEIIL